MTPQPNVKDMLEPEEVKLLVQSEDISVDDNNKSAIEGSHVAATTARSGDDKMADPKKVQAYQQGSDKGGYERVPQPGLPTYTEAWALIEAARRMVAAADSAGEDIKERNRVRDSLRLNWRLWTIFQAEMTVDNTSNLPDDVRTNMLTLCKFVDKHTVEALKDPVPQKIATLIEINRNIASGLLASLENANKIAVEEGEGSEEASEENTDSAADALANLNTKV